MKFTYFEEVLKLLVATEKNPAEFVHLFDHSSLLIGFNFCCRSRMFTHISHSFKKILGYERGNILYNNYFLDNIIHPHDRITLQNHLLGNSTKKNTETGDVEHLISHYKCRCKHIRNYWKYLICFSIIMRNESTNALSHVGLIADQGFKSFLNFMSTDDQKLKSGSFSKEGISAEPNAKGAQVCVSRREIEILELIGKGMIAKGIADKLNISLSTVITHRKNLIAKFSAHNTAELVKISTQLMLV